MHCSRCGATLAQGAKFCPACGSPAAQVSAAALPGYEAPNAPLYSAPVRDETVPKVTNGLAVAALVLGILWLYWIGSILAVIFGHVAKGQIERAGGAQTGRGMAIAGLVLGWVGVGVMLLGLVAFMLAR